MPSTAAWDFSDHNSEQKVHLTAFNIASSPIKHDNYITPTRSRKHNNTTDLKSSAAFQQCPKCSGLAVSDAYVLYL